MIAQRCKLCYHFLLILDNAVKEIGWLKYLIFYLTVQSRSDENPSSLCLPTHLTNLLNTPTGHCFVCCSSYFTAVFLLEESADTALQVVKPNSESLQRLRDVACSFVFCCCSRSCLLSFFRFLSIFSTHQTVKTKITQMAYRSAKDADKLRFLNFFVAFQRKNGDSFES